MALNLQNFFRRSQTRDGTPRFSLTLSAPAAAMIGTIALVILGWCFFMGFMVGRGQNPEKHLEEIAGILQQNEKENADTQPSASTDAGKDAAGTPSDTASAQDSPAQPAGTAAPSVSDAAAPAPAPQPQKTPPAAPAAPAEPSFVFSYRLATVKTQDAALLEQKRYAAKGIHCNIQKSGNIWTLVLTLRGTDKDDAALRQKIKAAGLASPMLLSRKKR